MYTPIQPILPGKLSGVAGPEATFAVAWTKTLPENLPNNR